MADTWLNVASSRQGAAIKGVASEGAAPEGAATDRGRGLRAAKVVGLASLALVFVAEPWVPAICPARLLFHIPCPSCGLTRAARSLLHGDLAGATRFHPLWWAVFGYLGPLALLEAFTYVRRGTFGQWTQHPRFQRLGMALVVALVVVWGAREAGALGGPVSLD